MPGWRGFLTGWAVEGGVRKADLRRVTGLARAAADRVLGSVLPAGRAAARDAVPGFDPGAGGAAAHPALAAAAHVPD
ncbi:MULTISPECIES: hypothetical protein [Streptomyces]|uniref:hypothetical protein n=1 Tax=Streptomyces TaxID=1883 RepID=UPI0004CD18B2|nr:MULTISPECIES: hypothetical protein [Streptomyces]KOT47256.1 hypothetical protein ADK43_39855 [Streptomyces rimosus subsp. rimosus]